MPPVIAIHNAVDAAEVINSGTALKLLFNDRYRQGQAEDVILAAGGGTDTSPSVVAGRCATQPTFNYAADGLRNAVLRLPCSLWEFRLLWWLL
jgi:hypothetical protein